MYIYVRRIRNMILSKEKAAGMIRGGSFHRGGTPGVASIWVFRPGGQGTVSHEAYAISHEPCNSISR
jgi:hypothetical protein